MSHPTNNRESQGRGQGQPEVEPGECGCPAYAPSDPDEPERLPSRTRLAYLEGAEPAADPERDGDPVVNVLVLDTPDWRPGTMRRLRNRGLNIGQAFREVSGLDHPRIGRRAEFAGDLNGDGYLDPVFGHEQFIEHIIGERAPRAHCHHIPVMTSFGASTDDIVAQALFHWLERHPNAEPGILNLSLGGYTANDEPPAALTQAVAELTDRGFLLVASAGNDASCRPTWPAALPEVIGVAALAESGPAYFTNFGPWVNACAPGVDVLGALPDPYIPISPQRTRRNERRRQRQGQGRGGGRASQNARVLMKDDGVPAPRGQRWAYWSGTSFATPIVVAALARHVELQHRRDPDGFDIRAALVNARHDLVDDPTLFSLPQLGTVINLPSRNRATIAATSQ